MQLETKADEPAATAPAGRYPENPGARGLPLSAKISLILLTVLSVGGLGLAWFGQEIVLGKFSETELELVLRNRAVLTRAVASEVEYLGSMTNDWSQWDDLYDFTLGRNPEFAAQELGGIELERLSLDLVVFLDTQGRVRESDIRPEFAAPGSAAEQSLEAAIVAALHKQPTVTARKKHPQLAGQQAASASLLNPVATAVSAPVLGLLDTDSGPIAIAARPILHSDASGPTAGTLVMARRIYVDRLSAALSVLPSHVVLRGSGSDALPAEIHELARRLGKIKDGASLVTRQDDMSDFQLFRDVNGKPAFLLETRMPRTVVATGRETTRLLLFALLVFGVIGLLVLMILVRNIISVPLTRLTNHMLALRQTGELLATPGRDSNDEIGTLARRFEELVSARREDQMQLERLAAAVEHAGDAVAILSSDGRIEYVNPQYERQTGYCREDVVGKSPGRGRSPEAQYAELWNKVYSGSSWSGMLQTSRHDGTVGFEDVTVSPIKDATGQVTSSVAVMRDITARRATEAELRNLSAVVEYTAECIVVLNADRRIHYVNPAYERSRRVRGRDVVGGKLGDIAKSRDDPAMYQEMWRTTASGRTWTGRIRSELTDGTALIEDAVVSPVMADGGLASSYVIILHDVRARIQLEEQLVQAQKLEAVGQLAAGVAHEINTPTQYVGGNIRFLRDAFTSVTDLLGELRELARQAGAGNVSGARIAAILGKADVDYLQGEVPAAIQQSLEGVERVGEIVRSMKELAHPARNLTPTDVNRIIESAVRVARNEWEGVAAVRMELDPGLAPVPCLAGGLNQVIVNMLVNAAHAIEESAAPRRGGPGTIVVATRQVGEWAEIRVMDDGAGMNEEVCARAFDPFFTTKQVGHGTGQGLAIAHSVIKKHGGSITVESEPGRGTCFTIRLPLGVGQGAGRVGIADDGGNVEVA